MTTATQAKPYADTIRKMQSTLKLKEAERLQTSEPDRILILDNEIDNLREAVSLFTRAQSVEPVLRQFGGAKARGLRVQLPPSSAEYHFKPMVFQRYAYTTDKPVELLYLREQIAGGRLSGLAEMDPGLLAAVSNEDVLIGFYPEEFLEALGKAGALKSQIG